jgi:hypothetical protein
MKTIEINGKKIKIYAEQIRALRILKAHGFAAKRGDFTEKQGSRSRRHDAWILPCILHDDFGVYEAYPATAKTAREKQFFAAHPRCQSGVFGNPRRINAILGKV